MTPQHRTDDTAATRDPAPDRRTVLRAAGIAGAAGAAGLAVTGCATAGGTKDPNYKPVVEGPVTVGRAEDVAVGKGKVYDDTRVVVTQPVAGDYKAFDGRCPHQGCLVSRVDQGVIHCACHGSQFSINDGSVIRRPAKSGLKAVPVKVVNGEIIVG